MIYLAKKEAAGDDVFRKPAFDFKCEAMIPVLKKEIPLKIHAHQANDISKIYGYGRSIWAMIDTETRQPCNLLDIRDGELVQWVEKEKENSPM